MNSADHTLAEALEAQVGYAFPDRALALTALTHRSWVNENRAEGREDNERLEFLGDAVLDLVVSEVLMRELRDAREGDLSRIRAQLVNTEALAKVSRRLGLPALLRLGHGEARTGGREKASLLANVLEAIIGAVYLSDGLGASQDFIWRHILEPAQLEALARGGGSDYKTRLQERVQAAFSQPPRYRVVETEGPPHDRTFSVEAFVDETVLGAGQGRSKKEAEQAAALAALHAWRQTLGARRAETEENHEST